MDVRLRQYKAKPRPEPKKRRTDPVVCRHCKRRCCGAPLKGRAQRCDACREASVPRRRAARAAAQRAYRASHYEDARLSEKLRDYRRAPSLSWQADGDVAVLYAGQRRTRWSAVPEHDGTVITWTVCKGSTVVGEFADGSEAMLAAEEHYRPHPLKVVPLPVASKDPSIEL